MPTFTLLGEPFPQPRPRTRVIKTKGKDLVTIYDPPEARKWKADAAATYRVALQRMKLPIPLYPEGAVALRVIAVYPCPVGDHRKQPRPRRWHLKRGDVDNIVKALQDAALGVLWTDDAQVVEILAHKIIARQGELPRTMVGVRALADLGAGMLRVPPIGGEFEE